MSRHTDNWTFNYGIDGEQETFDADQTLFDFPTALSSGGLQLDEAAKVGRYPGYEVTGVAVFAQAEWQTTDWLQLSAGVRQQRYYLDIDDFVAANEQVRQALGLSSGADAIPGGKNHYDTTLFNLGAIATLSPGHQLWANLSQGYELPDPGKYYGNGTYAYNGTYRELVDSVNVDEQPLKAIKTNQAELGWRLYRSRFDTQLAAYYSWSDESLSYDRSNLSVQVNDEKKRNYGLEGQLNVRLSEQWQVGTSGHWTRAELRTDGDWEKQAVTQASSSKLAGYAGWHNDLSSLRLQGTRTMDLDDAAGNELDGYTTFDLIGQQRLPVGQHL